MREGLTFDDVLIVPRFSDIKSRSNCDTYSEMPDLSLSLPVISANMDTITEYKMAYKMDFLGGLGIVHRYMTIEKGLEIHDLLNKIGCRPVVMSVGSINKDKDRIDAYLAEYIEGLCIDIAHGDSQLMVDTIRYIRGLGHTGLLIAGNVATRMAAVRLKNAGADIIKVGIGPGSVCTTRIKTGVGIPQLTAIMDCARAGDMDNLPDIPVIADGGMKTSGDICKALVAGAKAVMIGGMLAGTDCVPGWIEAWAEVIKKDGDLAQAPYIQYRGMASFVARQAFTGSWENNHEEGIATQVLAKEKGSTEGVVKGIKEGIQSCMSYVGANNLNDLHKHATFIKVTPATVIENHPHKKLSN